METQAERMVQGNEGDGITPADTAVSSSNGPESEVVSTGAEGSTPVPPAGYENVPQELWPGPDGKPVQLTEKLMKRLRGRYFTVKHVRLIDCGHKMDMINEPRHRNCENCWFQWFNVHPQLVEVADQMFREQGKKAMEGLRGTHFVKMFVRYMATVIQFMKEEGRLPSGTTNQGQPVADSGNSTADAQAESGQVASEVTVADQS